MRPTAASRGNSTSDRPPFGLDLSLAVFDRAARLAQGLFAGAGASVILLHEGRIWRSHFADVLPARDPVTEAVLATGELLWVADGHKDARFAKHPLVVGPPYLRFTIAVPIRLQDGATPGVLSVSGPQPQPFDADKAARLRDLADFIADEWARALAVAALAKSLRERDLALERSERSEARLKLALALADIHVWELDYVRRELSKAGAEDTFFAAPLTYEDLYRDLYVTVDARDRERVKAAWRDHLENGTAYRPEHRINRRDGKEVWVQSAVEVFSDARGRPLRIVGAMQNITARKHAEFALRQAKEAADVANRAKTDFLATMSHELRTPLNAILGFAEIIRERIMGPVSDQYAGYAADIHASGRHLLDLVNDVLDIAKLEAGKVELHESLFDPRDLLHAVAASFRQQAESAGIAVCAELPALPPLRADERLLRQVLLNVLSNALKFTPSGGTVTLGAAHRAGAGLEITVADTGIGMTAAEIAIAMTPFGQIDSQVARRFKGTGLGLPISLSLMRLHGGGLRLESQPAVGTRVILTLPEVRIAGDA